MPADERIALILVQHLDPSHESMMVELLAPHTALTVRQAQDGLAIEGGHLYVIPPGAYLAVSNGVLKLSDPQVRHGSRMPFDFLLQSMAGEVGARRACIVLSGTGSDGSIGARALKASGGLVIAQDPEEAMHDGMPRGAIATGAVDKVLPVAGMAKALVAYQRRKPAAMPAPRPTAPGAPRDAVPDIIALLRDKTSHDFTLYKPGTLRRRITRRMALLDIEGAATDRYLELLRRDPAELDLLSKDLLIHVTSFFRDTRVFDYLARTVIPELVDSVPPDKALRIWIPGCSTGEEVYSILILLREHLEATQRSLRLQVFASDVDADAVARAREGLFPGSIASEVSAERLARFFTREGDGYRVRPELRNPIVFTVQDLLTDAPFSQLDMVSCRNLLIYLGPEAQKKVVSLFHFALRPGGILLLGNAETVGQAAGRFEALSKTMRVYRHVGRSRPGDLDFLVGAGSPDRLLRLPSRGQLSSRSAAYAELCRRLVMNSFAPAAVLIDAKHECLHSVGPTERYLRVPPGAPTHDILGMVPRSIRTKLRSAIQRASDDRSRVIVPSGPVKLDGALLRFDIDVQPARLDDEDLLLVAFVARPAPVEVAEAAGGPREPTSVTELQRELDATRLELQGAIHNLEMSNDALKGLNEEARSASEEYQSTNEELLTSKEELQSLNEELTALNTQLQETLERQRTTATDLQNVLYSTDVATLFLDPDLRIRFFTPATTALVRIIAADIGRPLSDLNLMASDADLLADARTVLRQRAATEREIAGRDGQWYLRRVLPYRTLEGGVEGVVITYGDITERRRAAEKLEEAKHAAERANALKSRFLAAASHDLRQPLQTMALLQGLLAKAVEGEQPRAFVARLGETLGSMSDMLNTLLDINQIEAGAIRPQVSSFAVGTLLDQLRGEFACHAEALNLELRMVPCTLTIESDPRLLGQILRNLISNALKYTRAGKVLVGCRRHGDRLRIEVWDTGIGIPEAERDAVFEEYHQIGNSARERSRGLGLGLAIARRFAELLGHRLSLRSRTGKGSVFTVEVAMPATGPAGGQAPPQRSGAASGQAVRRTGAVLVVEDDPELREALRALLAAEGHVPVVAPDGAAALDLVARSVAAPDIVIMDYNLPGGMDGFVATARLRAALNREVPAIILSGARSPATSGDGAPPRCVQLYKPVQADVLTSVVQDLLSGSGAPPAGTRR